MTPGKIFGFKFALISEEKTGRSYAFLEGRGAQK